MIYVLKNEEHWKQFDRTKDLRDWFYHVVSRDPQLYLEFLSGTTVKDSFYIYSYRMKGSV